MNLHTLKGAEGARHSKTRVGRGKGSGLGKTSGRGHKGQYARSGHKHKPGFEGGQMRLARRLPKRGFFNVNTITYIAVNVGDLSRFDEGTEVTPDVLRGIGMAKGPGSGIKILGTGDLSRKLVVKAHAFSAVAKTKIEALGGTCETIGR